MIDTSPVVRGIARANGEQHGLFVQDYGRLTKRKDKQKAGAVPDAWYDCASSA
jgi:hypothetical protein